MRDAEAYELRVSFGGGKFVVAHYCPYYDTHSPCPSKDYRHVDHNKKKNPKKAIIHASKHVSFLLSSFYSHTLIFPPFYSLLMDKYRYCTLCSRRFPSALALAGHMRAHAAAEAGEAEDNKEKLGSGAAYGLRENPRKSFRIVDPEFSSASVLVEDGESEAESLLEAAAASHRRRSKPPRVRSQAPLADSGSSASDVKTEEDVALCLLMLSRDSWPGVKESPLANSRDEEDNRRRVARWRPPRTGPIKRQCARWRTRSGYDFEDDAIPKIHECPLCSRVFASGQALGGHKRSHFTTWATTIIVTSCSQPRALTAAGTCRGDFDLVDFNVPAPADEEMALSTVSDAELLQI